MRRVLSQIILIILPIIFISVLIAIIFIILPQTKNNVASSSPTPAPVPTPIYPNFSFTPSPLDTTSFQSTALGFTIDYPTGWRRKEKSLEVIFSPSSAGLDTANLEDSAIWIGLSASDIVDPVELLRAVLADFPAEIEVLTQGTTDIASETWASVQISYGSKQGIATILTTSKNEVGYFIAAAAPAGKWDTVQPLFQQTISSFRFNENAVLRPTDATPPPTPTPTPTPVVYIVQSGDTLLKIAIMFDVKVELLVNRNGIDNPSLLRTGQALIIPRKRKR